MKNPAAIVAAVLCVLVLGALPVRAQVPPPPPPPPGGGMQQGMHRQDWTPEQREQWREERRQRREQWQQLSPEERHQLRRDIRDAGQTLYPRRGPRHPND